MESKEKTPVFKGSELIRAARGIDRDVLRVVLDPQGRYTEAEAAKRAAAFLKKEVGADGGR